MVKLNPDCFRTVLIAVEEKPFNETYRFQQLAQKLDAYSADDIAYSCLKLKEAGFLDIVSSSYLGHDAPVVKSIKDITYAGHEFLDKVRSDSVWKETKTQASKVGSFAIDVLSQIAANVISSKLGF